ncbi:MAG: DNA-methyltransferase [Promethearchaeota archaeon]
MKEVKESSIDLIITSPPYPMIEMWDSLFFSLNEDIHVAFEQKDGKKAFFLMHKELEKTWKECIRVLKPGGIICINIGDATRKINKVFQLYPNHVKISIFFQENDFLPLPIIIWNKPTNSPTKFLGSGMLPPNAYVTLEHEYILIFQKGMKKRQFKPKLEHRYNSAYFWEERNRWFSDVWSDIKGISQNIEIGKNNRAIRERSAAFPLEIPLRLINMFSLQGDTILDPFWGTGTTTLAAMRLARNSIGYELNLEFKRLFEKNLSQIKKMTSFFLSKRLLDHVEFIKHHVQEGKNAKYKAIHYDFLVITQQEREILFYSIKNVEIKNSNVYIITHEKFKFEESMAFDKGKKMDSNTINTLK